MRDRNAAALRSWEQLLGELKTYVPNLDDGFVERAHNMAQDAHRGQERDEGVPFIEHPQRVALMLAEELRDRDPAWWEECPYSVDELLAIALLHDAIEDTEMTVQDVAAEIGVRAANAVQALSKPPKENFPNREMRTKSYLGQLVENYPRALLLVKLCDRLHNVQCVHRSRKDKAERYLAETIKLYLPLARHYEPQLADKLEAELETLRAHLSASPQSD